MTKVDKICINLRLEHEANIDANLHLQKWWNQFHDVFWSLDPVGRNGKLSIINKNV